MEVKKSTFFNQNYEDCCTFDRSKVYILLKKWAFLLLLASQKVYILLKYTPCMKNLAGKDSSFTSFKCVMYADV